MRTTVTTVCGVTCLRANSSPADCASRRPSELSLPKISTTRRVAAAAGAAPGSAAGVATVAAEGPGDASSRGRRRNGAERGQLLEDSVLQHLDLSLLQVGDELALLVAHDEVERDDLGARNEAGSRRRRLGSGRRLGGGRRLGERERRQEENSRDDRTRHLLRHAASWCPEHTPTLALLPRRGLRIPLLLPRTRSRAASTVWYRRARRRLRGHEENDRMRDRLPSFFSRLSASPRLPRSSPEKRRRSPSWAPGW